MADREGMTPAKVLWGIGLGKPGSVKEWMPYETSDIDWLANTTHEAIRMLDAADRIAKGRAARRRYPKLEIWIDEEAKILGYEGMDPDRQELRARISSLMSTPQSVGVCLVIAACSHLSSTSPEPA